MVPKVNGLTLLLELNLMKKAWRQYGVDRPKSTRYKKIIEWGTELMITSEPLDEIAIKYNKNKDKYLMIFGLKSKGVG